MVNYRRMPSAAAMITVVAAVSLLNARNAQADVVFAWTTHPATTAGGGATSTRSGLGTWHLYAVDTGPTNFGISSYKVTMGNVTAINHRSPRATIDDEDGEPYSIGFTFLRTGTNVSPIQASLDLSGENRYPITGFGRTASSFDARLPDYISGIGQVVSGSWGNYSISIDNMLREEESQLRWLFLAEGSYNYLSVFTPLVVSAEATVFADELGTTSVAANTKIIRLPLPEPATLSLVALATIASLGARRRI